MKNEEFVKCKLAQGHLVVHWTRTSMAQSRSFAIVGPSNWNKLP